ncbi:MAG: hypothetical protein L0H26_06420 [Microlunatus sp.]|nr:hypothetical protein [Microlunatus sp.]
MADRGFASGTNRAYLIKGGGHYIHAEKLRHTNVQAGAALAGRYKSVEGNLRLKEDPDCAGPARTATVLRLQPQLTRRAGRPAPRGGAV